MIFQFEQSIHGPARIAEMTGLSMDGQRNWRLRGHLPPSDGPRGKMTSSAVAALAVRSLAADLGVPAKESASLGETAGPSVLYSALLNFPQAAIQLIGSPHKKKAFWQEFEGSTDHAGFISGLEPQQPSSAICWHDNDSPRFLQTPNSGLVEGFDVTFRQISLPGVGARLVRFAGQPLFTVHISDD